MRYFTSDLHFGHKNIIALEKRPFRDLAHMHECLTRNWNCIVSDSDDVWVLGDMFLGHNRDFVNTLGHLKGNIVLYVGNHDGPFKTKGRNREIRRFEDVGIEVRFGPDYTTLSDGTPVTVSHFPYFGDSQLEDRYASERPVNNGGWLLHGHSHSRWVSKQKMINVGTDVWFYTPVSEHTLVEMIKRKERKIDAKP